MRQLSIYLTITVALSFIPVITAYAINDIDGDGTIGLPEAIYALQVVSGIKADGTIGLCEAIDVLHIVSGIKTIPDNIVQNSQTFEMPTLFAASRRFTFRVSGLCGQNCNNGPRHMYTEAFQDRLLVSWMSFYDTDEEAWSNLYGKRPEGPNWSDYRQYGNVASFSVSDTGAFSFVSNVSFKNKSESTHGMTTNADGSLIAVLVRGYPYPDQLKNPILPGAIDLLGTLRDENCASTSEPDCYPSWTYTDIGAPMYIFEYEGGAITAEPDNIILVNRAAGGWSYGHNEIELNRDGNIYFVHLKVQSNPDGSGTRHENVRFFAIERTDEAASGYRFVNNWGFRERSCGGGHPRSFRLAYNNHYDVWSQLCNLDTCPHYCDQPNRKCTSISFQTIPGFIDPPENVTLENEYLLELEHPWTLDWVTSGGAFTSLSLGIDGWIATASGPGGPFEGVVPDDGDATKSIGIKLLPVDIPSLRHTAETATGTDCTSSEPEQYNTYQWNWLSLPGPATSRVGLANIAYFGSVGEDSQRMLLGWSPNIGRKGITSDFVVSQIDRQGNFVGETLVLNSAGWGEDNKWVTMPNSGCVVFPFVWNSGAEGKTGYPVEKYEAPYDGYTSTLQLTSICPGGCE